MWPERLLKVAQTIRGMVDESGMARLYELALFHEPLELDGVESYDSRLRRVLETLFRSIAGLLEVAESLSIPLGNSLRREVSKVKRVVEGASERMETVALIQPASSLKPTAHLEPALSRLPAYDYLLLSRVSDLQRSASKLAMAAEEGDGERVLEYSGLAESTASDLLRLLETRTPENLSSIELLRGVLHEGGLYDLEVGLHLTSLGAMRRDDRQGYLGELAMFVHAAVEETGGQGSSVHLDDVYDGLSCASFLIEIGTRDVMFCLGELLERGWVEGMGERDGYQVLELRRPGVEHLVEGLHGRLRGADVTTEGAMAELGWDYFTALHVIKRLEESGDMEPDDGARAGYLWHWVETGSNRSRDAR